MQMDELLSALDKLLDCKRIFTMPNADTDGREIFQLIQSFCLKNQMQWHLLLLGKSVICPVLTMLIWLLAILQVDY